MNGAVANYAPWTAAEDARLREVYLDAGIAAAKLALPSRSVGSICHRAQRLGVVRRRRWTATDDARLRMLWDGERTIVEVAKALHRTPITTYWRAQQIGLRLGCPEGWEYLSHACERTGYGPGQLRRIIAAAGATIRRALAAPRVKSSGTGHPTWIVCPGEVDTAIEAWHETEPVETAARRLGIAGETLSRRLRKLGLEKPATGAAGRAKAKRHWRVRAEDVALAMRVPKGTRWAQQGDAP
jgi:hypothetical protein